MRTKACASHATGAMRPLMDLELHDGWRPIRLRYLPLLGDPLDEGRDRVVTDVDAVRLRLLLEEQADRLEAQGLERALQQARVINARLVPEHVVTMNSRVLCENEVTGASQEYRLLYPTAWAPRDDEVCVISELGTALLGVSVGTRLTHDQRRLRVVRVTYQPEREGHYHL